MSKGMAVGEKLANARTLRMWMATIGVGDSRSVRLVMAVLVLIVGSALLTSIAPVTFKLMIDRVTAPTFDSWERDAIWFAAAYVALLGVARVLSEAQAWCFGRLEQSWHVRIRTLLLEHICRLPLAFHLDTSVGKTAQAINNATRGASTAANAALLGVAPIVTQMIAIALIVTHYCSDYLGAILIAASIAYAWSFAIGSRKLGVAQKDATKSVSDFSASITDALSHPETTKYLCAEESVIARAAKHIACVEGAWLKYYRTRSLQALSIAAIFATTLGSAVAISFYQLVHAQMTIGDFVLVNTYLLQIVRPLEVVGYAYRDVRLGISLMAEAADIISLPLEPRTDGVKEVAEGSICMANVTFNYQEKNSCIHDLSIDVKAGQTLALVGPSGGGKSTIARLLTGIYSPNSGDIFIDNRSITSIPLHSLRRGVVVVPQVTALFDDTVTFNLAVGLPSVSVAAQREALDRVGLEAWVAALPSGLNTMVGPRGLKLSAGQRQRLGLARALLREPKVLVLDEVTSSLDIHTEFDILAAISEMFPHSTKVIIAHRLHTVTHADIIAVVRDGRLVQCGTHAQLIEADGMYACMWLQHSRSTSEPIVEELT